MKPSFENPLSGLYEENGLIVANIFDAKTGDHLTTGFMNPEAWEQTQQTGLVHFWLAIGNGVMGQRQMSSRNDMKVISRVLNCNKNVVDIYVDVLGDGIACRCYGNRKSCFFNKVL
jgi:phosphoribosyl-AMP cyclohydrolase